MIPERVPHPLDRVETLNRVVKVAASVRDRIVSRPRVLAWMRRAFAAAFVALGAKLAVAER